MLEGDYQSNLGSLGFPGFHLHLASKIMQALSNAEEPKATVAFKPMIPPDVFNSHPVVFHFDVVPGARCAGRVISPAHLAEVPGRASAQLAAAPATMSPVP